MTENKYAPSAWGTPQFRDLEVPSGQLCQVKPPGIQQLISEGLLDNSDTLLALIDEKHIKRVKGRPTPAKNGVQVAAQPQVDTATILKDPTAVTRMFELVDKVTALMVIQPNVRRPVKEVDGKEIVLPFEEREEGIIYTDQVDIMDKMYIFQYAVGGDANLEQFRKQFSSRVGSVAAV